MLFWDIDMDIDFVNCYLIILKVKCDEFVIKCLILFNYVFNWKKFLDDLVIDDVDIVRYNIMINLNWIWKDMVKRIFIGVLFGGKF